MGQDSKNPVFQIVPISNTQCQKWAKSLYYTATVQYNYNSEVKNKIPSVQLVLHWEASVHRSE